MKYLFILILFSCGDPDKSSPEVLPDVISESPKPDTLDYKGPIKQIKIDSTKKCNRIEGFYSLESTVPDSSSLAHIAKYIASKLYSENPGHPNCKYPVMAGAYLYVNTKEFDAYEGGWVAMCSNGDVAVDMLKLRKLKFK